MTNPLLRKIAMFFFTFQKEINIFFSLTQARLSFAQLDDGVFWSPYIDWENPERIYLNKNTTLKRFVRLYAGKEEKDSIILGANVVISENVLLKVNAGSLIVDEGAIIGENAKIIVNNGKIVIGKNVVINNDTEIIAEDGDVSIGDKTHIDARCRIRGNGSYFDGQKIYGKINLGTLNYIGYATVIESNGGYVTAEENVKIDYENIIAGAGGIYFEKNSHFRHSNYVDAFKEEFRFGEKTTVGQKCIFAGRGPIKIGSESLIGGMTFMVSENHKAERFDVPYRYQGHTYSGITLKNNVWVGGQSLILDGVTIGEGSLIGGGSVVTKDIEPWSFVVGSPATRKKDIRD